MNALNNQTGIYILRTKNVVWAHKNLLLDFISFFCNLDVIKTAFDGLPVPLMMSSDTVCINKNVV